MMFHPENSNTSVSKFEMQNLPQEVAREKQMQRALEQNPVSQEQGQKKTTQKVEEASQSKSLF